MRRGFGIAALQVGELAPDDKVRFRDGVIKLFEGTTEGSRPANAWGGLAAWAWGASRAMDYFVSEPRINPKRVVVVGHSRGGKAALWAGAEDERFAMVVSNESGEGGAALSRRNYGETVARITEVVSALVRGELRRIRRARGLVADRSAHAALARRAARPLCRERRPGPLVRSAR